MGERLREVGRVGREMPCAGCGYDLRGTGVVGGERRCSECGAVWRGRRVSRVPWGRRREVGRVRGYLMTLWMVVWRPWAVGREVEGWVRAKDVRTFERVSVWLGTVVAMMVVGSRISSPSVRGLAPQLFWVRPIVVVTATLWSMSAVGVSFYFTARFQLWVYKGLVRGSEAPGVRRARAGRVAGYISALVPLAAVCLGAIFFLHLLWRLNASWMDAWRTWVLAGIIGIGVLGGMAGLWCGMQLLRTAGHLTVARGVVFFLETLLMLLFFVGTFLVSAWEIGYGVMAAYSMTY